jgi:PEP-CTERM motif-containing protein
MPQRLVRGGLVAGTVSAALIWASAGLAQNIYTRAPVALPPGGSVSSLPNGGSSYPGDEGVTEYDDTFDFSFDGGFLAGDLRERVLSYSQTNEYHPYGGLYFDYEITLTAGDVLSDGATRTSNGDIVMFSFADGDLVGGMHSANLQFLTNALYFTDPMGTFTLSNGDTFSVPLIGGAIPEASTWVMLLFGFAGMGVLGRRSARQFGAGGRTPAVGDYSASLLNPRSRSRRGWPGQARP